MLVKINVMHIVISNDPRTLFLLLKIFSQSKESFSCGMCFKTLKTIDTAVTTTGNIFNCKTEKTNLLKKSAQLHKVIKIILGNI